MLVIMYFGVMAMNGYPTFTKAIDLSCIILQNLVFGRRFLLTHKLDIN